MLILIRSVNFCLVVLSGKISVVNIQLKIRLDSIKFYSKSRYFISLEEVEIPDIYQITKNNLRRVSDLSDKCEKKSR